MMLGPPRFVAAIPFVCFPSPPRLCLANSCAARLCKRTQNPARELASKLKSFCEAERGALAFRVSGRTHAGLTPPPLAENRER